MVFSGYPLLIIISNVVVDFNIFWEKLMGYIPVRE